MFKFYHVNVIEFNPGKNYIMLTVLPKLAHVQMSFVCTIHQTTPNLGMEERCIYTHVTPPVRVTVIRNTGDGLFKKLRTHMWQLESLLFSFFTDNRGKKFSIVFLNFAKGKLGIVPSLRLMDFLCQSAGRFVPQPETIFVKKLSNFNYYKLDNSFTLI